MYLRTYPFVQFFLTKLWLVSCSALSKYFDPVLIQNHFRFLMGTPTSSWCVCLHRYSLLILSDQRIFSILLVSITRRRLFFYRSCSSVRCNSPYARWSFARSHQISIPYKPSPKYLGQWVLNHSRLSLCCALHF